MDEPSTATATTTRKVLVVEDTRDIRELLVDILEAEGYSVRSCANGAEALGLLTHERFDVVLLDLMMPVMDGLQLLEALHLSGPLPAPIIAMSAFERFHLAARDLGAAAFIGKPVDIDHLLRAVASHANDATVH